MTPTGHAKNVVNAFFAVHTVVFDFLPVLDDQESCFGALSLLKCASDHPPRTLAHTHTLLPHSLSFARSPGGLIDDDDLRHQLDRALKRKDSSIIPSARFSLVLHAVQSNWPRVLEALLALPSWADEVDAELFQKCVWLCAEKGFHECLAALISARPDVLVVRIDGTTVLHWAAQNGHHSCCEWLVDVGQIDINTPNNIKQTPLMYAVGSLETVSWFLSREECDIDLVDDERMSAFQHASQERSAVAVAVMDMLMRRASVGTVA